MFFIRISNLITKLYAEYQRHSGIMLPLLALNIALIFVDKIPYLNLFGTTISTIVLIVTILCISILYRSKKVFVYLFVFLILVWILTTLVGLSIFQEAIGSSLYILAVGAVCWMLYDLRTSKIETSSHIEEQRALFNQEFAHIVSPELAAWQQSYVDRIKKYLLIDHKRHARIIELGCGDGKLSIEMAKLGHSVSACDISDRSIQLTRQFAKQANVSIDTVQCDVTKLPFRNAEFDYAIAGAILEHLEEESTALKEWSRVLKKGGRIMIVTPLRQRHVLPIWWVLNWFHDRRLGHVRRYDKKRYDGLKIYDLDLTAVVYTGHTPKVIVAILHILTKLSVFENLAEKVDAAFEHWEYDGNNIIGFFQKK